MPDLSSNYVIAALLLEQVQLEEQCQGEPWDVAAIEYIGRLIDRIASKTPGEQTEHVKAMATVIGKAMLYERAWNRYANPDTSPELTEVERRLQKADAHQALLIAVRAMRGN